MVRGNEESVWGTHAPWGWAERKQLATCTNSEMTAAQARYWRALSHAMCRDEDFEPAWQELINEKLG